VSDGAGTASASATGSGPADAKADAGSPQNAANADDQGWSAAAAGPNGVAPATDEKTRCVPVASALSQITYSLGSHLAPPLGPLSWLVA